MSIDFKRLLIGLFLISWMACTPETEDHSSTPLFSLLDSSQSGLNFANRLTPTPSWNIIDYLYFYNGAGVATGDINNDGLIDLFFTSNQQQDQLFLNEGNLTFRNISDEARIAAEGWSTGVTMADVDGNGWLDIYVCQVGGGYKGQQGRNRLYMNNGDATFTERSEEYGLDFSGLSTQAAFFDYDRDGDLDMYLLNHSVHSVNSYGPSSLREESDPLAGDRLYKNESETGKLHFTEVTRQANIYTSQLGYGLGITLLDHNNDGWVDIYISNDFHENDYLYENQQNGTFREIGQEVLGHTSRYSMGNESADINNDGHTDLMTLDMLPEDPHILRKSAAEDHIEVSDIKEKYGYGHQLVRNTLQLNWGDGQYSDLAPYAGVYATDWSWSPLIADFDNDGWNDIYVTNGIVKRPNDLDYIQYLANAAHQAGEPTDEEMVSKMPDVKITNYMFRSRGDLTFEKTASSWGLDVPSFSSGASYADLDNDGDLDIVVNNSNDPAFLFENHQNTLRSHYLEIILKGKSRNTSGIGARARLYQQDRMLQRELFTSRGFLSGVAPRLYFGLGLQASIDSLTIAWPDGIVETFHQLPGDTLLTLREGNGRKAFHWFSEEIAEDEPAYFPFTHKENVQFKDYKREPLIPYNLSREGPALAVADVNGDGREDVYTGGAQGQPGALYLQQSDGTFKPGISWSEDRVFEDVDAVFTDVDGDGDPDLLVASGGNQFNEGHPFLQDRIYLNERGTFSEKNRLFLPLSVNTSCLRPADLDGDGLPEIFVGVRSKVGAYGVAPANYLLHNLGHGRFEEDQSFHLTGMVTDALWSDFDNDRQPDLAVVGDWMRLTILHSTHGKIEKTETVAGTSGWWRSLAVADLNNDGFPDLIAGNKGKNGKISPTKEKSAELLLNDFDNNGQTDPVLFYWQGNEFIPFASKDALGKQMPPLNKKFQSYAGYAAATDLNKVFEDMHPESLQSYNLETLASTTFINNQGSSFTAIELPAPAQWSTVNAISIFHESGEWQCLLAGNSPEDNIDLGYDDAMPAILLIWKNEKWEVKKTYTGTHFKGYFTHLSPLQVRGRKYVLLGANNGPVRMIERSGSKP